MPDKCLDCPVPSADMDGFIVSGPGGAPRSEGSGVSSPEGPFVREAPQTGHFILKGKVSSSSPLPDVPEPGWAYEAAEAGTYGGVHATPGDLLWCAGVNPVQWRIAQSDFDGAVRSVSVQQVLSSGTKIATVTVDGQATDLFCNPSGLASVSASFDCGGQTWYLSSHEVTSYVEDDNDYVVHDVAPALLDGDLSVDLTPTWVGGSASHYVLSRVFLLSNVPVYGGVCYYLARGYDVSNIFISEGYEDIAPEDLVLFSLHSIIENYSMPAAGEEIELPVNLATYYGTGILPVTGIGASASAYSCTGRDRMVVHEMPDQLSASPLKFYATGPASGYIGSLRVEKNSAFDWSQYESGAKLTLTSTSASGEETVQEVDMSCLGGGGGIQTLSGDFGCETHELSPAVDEPAVFNTTEMVFIDQTGFEMLEGGNAPYGHYSGAFSGSDSLSHLSSSFSTAVPASAPYAVALKTYKPTPEPGIFYCLKSSNILDWQYYGAVKVSDLLAAGDAGVKLMSSGEIPYGDGTLDVYASFSANQDGSYAVSYSARKDAVSEDILTAKIDGKDGSGAAVSSVDVSPLLNYIGGRVEEVPAGDSEMLPLVDQENPGVEPPFYFTDFGFYNDSYQQNVSPDTVGFSDGVMTVSFSASSPELESLIPLCFYGDPSGRPIFAYAKLDSSTGNPAKLSFETALAGPLVLDELDISSGQPVTTGSTVSLVTKRLGGDAPAYSFTLYSGSVEMKKVLRLYPSCDGEIDLSGLGGGGGTSAETLSFECGVAPSAPDVSVQSAGANVTPMFYNPPFTPSTYFDVDGRTFTIKGSTFNSITRGFSTTTMFYLTVEAGDASYYFRTSSDAMAYFFSGAHGIGVGTVRHFIGSNYGFRLERREELTSSDPGGPDVVCTFGFVDCGGDLLSLGDQSVNLSCIAEHAGPGDYSQAYSRTISSGDAAPYELDLSSVVNDADGFYDVFVVVRVSNYTSISVKSDRFTTVTLDCSAVSSGSPVLGAVRFWCDGGCRRYSYGTVSSPSAYNVYGISMTEVSLLNYSSPMSPYSSSKITISPPSGSTFSSTVTVKVYVRQPHSAV